MKLVEELITNILEEFEDNAWESVLSREERLEALGRIIEKFQAKCNATKEEIELNP